MPPSLPVMSQDPNAGLVDHDFVLQALTGCDTRPTLAGKVHLEVSSRTDSFEKW